MGRLIDADALLEALKSEPSYQIEVPRYLGNVIQQIIEKHQSMVCKVIEKQPTAYDVEKVVAKIEEDKFKVPGDEDEKIINHYLDRAINEVKAGGVK